MALVSLVWFAIVAYFIVGGRLPFWGQGLFRVGTERLGLASSHNFHDRLLIAIPDNRVESLGCKSYLLGHASPEGGYRKSNRTVRGRSRTSRVNIPDHRGGEDVATEPAGIAVEPPSEIVG